MEQYKGFLSGALFILVGIFCLVTALKKKETMLNLFERRYSSPRNSPEDDFEEYYQGKQHKPKTHMVCTMHLIIYISFIVFGVLAIILSI